METIEDQIAAKVGLMWGNANYSPRDLTQAIAEWHRAGLRALGEDLKGQPQHTYRPDRDKAIDDAVSRAAGEGANE